LLICPLCHSIGRICPVVDCYNVPLDVLHPSVYHINCWLGLDPIRFSKEVIIFTVCFWFSMISQSFEACALAIAGDYELMDCKSIVLQQEVE
jgi:hypothetical protein